MKLANFFTAVRIVLAPIFFFIFFFPLWTGRGAVISIYILVPLFIFMEFTDFLDGYFARKQKSVSDFGKLFDPFADVLANLTVLLSFMLAGYLPAILFIIILYREMAIMFVRMLAARSGIAIAARKGGKTKTVFYIIAAGFSLAIEATIRLGIDLGNLGSSLGITNLSLFGIGLGDLPSIVRCVNLGLYIVAVVLSVVSFIDYLVHFSAVLRKTENK